MRRSRAPSLTPARTLLRRPLERSHPFPPHPARRPPTTFRHRRVLQHAPGGAVTRVLLRLVGRGVRGRPLPRAHRRGGAALAGNTGCSRRRARRPMRGPRPSASPCIPGRPANDCCAQARRLPAKSHSPPRPTPAPPAGATCRRTWMARAAPRTWITARSPSLRRRPSARRRAWRPRPRKTRGARRDARTRARGPAPAALCAPLRCSACAVHPGARQGVARAGRGVRSVSNILDYTLPALSLAFVSLLRVHHAPPGTPTTMAALTSL